MNQTNLKTFINFYIDLNTKKYQQSTLSMHFIITYDYIFIYLKYKYKVTNIFKLK